MRSTINTNICLEIPSDTWRRKSGEAAKTYANDPIALHLRAMNMLYEGLKQNATIVIVPSAAVETMQRGGLARMTALTMGLGQERTSREKEGEPVKHEDV